MPEAKSVAKRSAAAIALRAASSAREVEKQSGGKSVRRSIRQETGLKQHVFNFFWLLILR